MARSGERPAGVFDIIGRRRWFYAFSLLITIPGFIFILLTPITGDAVGIKFSIDYTGGTVWSIRFQDPNVTPDQVQAGNKNWWSSNPMTYDWHGELSATPLSLPWFDAVDRR